VSDWVSAKFEPGLISAVVPTHNRVDLLRRTLASLLNQSCEKLQIVLVDDGSSDSTSDCARRIARTLQGSARRSLLYLRQDHQGAPAARNLGASRSRGEYICFLDDDDLVSADRLQNLYDAATARGADLSFGPWTYFTRVGNDFSVRALHNRTPSAGTSPILEAWLRGWSFYLPGTLLSRRLLKKAGPWNSALRICQDLEFCARCLAADPVAAHTAIGLLYRRHHSGTLSRKSFADYEDSLVLFADLLEETTVRRFPGERGKRLAAQYLAHCAVRFYARGSRVAASYCERKALECAPDLRLLRGGLATRLAFALGGFRLVAAKNHFRSRLKSLFRAVRGTPSGFKPVDCLEGVELTELEGV
jgi:glycosyltransferase involved in cell wall biosynthesis